MLLDRLVANLDLRIEPFATCDVRSGWTLDLRPPRTAVLHFVLSGSGVLDAAGFPSTELTPDVLVIIPPGLGHRVCSAPADRGVLTADSGTIGSGEIANLVAGDGDAGVTLVCGRAAATYGGLIGLFSRLSEPLVVDFSDEPLMRHAFAAIMEEQRTPRPGSASMMASLMNQCFIQMLRRLCDAGDCRLSWLSAIDDERLGRVVDAILAHPEQPHSQESLAALAGMSRTAFTERFSQVFDRSAAEFVRDTRLERGGRLLTESALPIKTIAGRVGFSSRSHFTKAFVDHFGVTPVEYRSRGG